MPPLNKSRPQWKQNYQKTPISNELPTQWKNVRLFEDFKKITSYNFVIYINQTITI